MSGAGAREARGPPRRLAPRTRPRPHRYGVAAFSEACGRDLPYVVEPRRAGDVTANWADCAKAREELGWEARYGIAEMCRDSWNWQSHNPNGYED